MGATNCPETPRQRLIAMMYLVLTALLALNVSKNVLDSFLIVNESLVSTNENFTKKIDGTYNQFDIQKRLAEAKVLPFWQKAQQAKKLSKEIIAYIEKVRTTCIARQNHMDMPEADTVHLDLVTARDMYDECTNYLINDNAGHDLKLKLEEYRKNMIDLLNPKWRKTIEKSIGLDYEGNFYDADQTKMDWENYNFYHTILAADVVILNKLVNEVKNAEYDVVSQLFSEVSIIDFKFDQIAAKIVPKSSYVMSGESFEADIFVAAYDSKQNPEVWYGDGVDSGNMVVSGNKVQVEAVNGVGKLKVPVGGVGIRKYGGTITVANGAEKKTYPYSGEYIVGSPSATIAPTQMNVIYIGVDNPFSISVPGASNDQVKVSVSGGGGVTITKTGNGLFNVRATTVTQKGNMCKITASASIGGKDHVMGSTEFRVKKVPDPIPTIGTVKQSGVITKGLLMASPIIPQMPPDFEFTTQFRIISFTLTMNVQGDMISKPGTGNTFTSDMKKLLDRAGRGTRVIIEDIKATGPDGTRNLPSMTLKIS